MNKLVISGSPHIHDHDSVSKIMYTVVLAMIPAMLASFWFFGFDSLRVMLVAVISALLMEWATQKFLLKGPLTINDGSAVVSGILLAFNLPAGIPSWMVVAGAFVMIGVAKMTFGGLGKNPFNPALVGRVFMLISFPVEMTKWPVPRPLFATRLADAITGPTALGLFKEGVDAGQSAQTMLHASQMPTEIARFFGEMGGSLGEVSAIAILLGGAYMVYKKVIDWQLPLSILLTAFLFSGLFYLINPAVYAPPMFHLLTGGLILGAVFMATDMVTSPMTIKGKVVFGVGIGLLTVTIRLWGSYPEGISFAILIMNAFTPLINKAFKPKRFGSDVLKTAKI
ncbi:MAG: RnfABCDGE type electron transport complex subunit D [Bacteroidales bacterium]|nr:RnfABCDGE type electron transport complex subunit D [Bacteroidales bacterium]